MAVPPPSPPSPPSSVAEVVARMQAIVDPLPRGDGVACFTRLYLAVTRGVEQRLAGVAFADPAFLARLDVAFAGLYFTAFEALTGDPQRVPRAWAPLFDARAERGIAPLQFALAGMNAHINRDLPVALVATCHDAGISPARGSAQHADFERVNGVLAAVEAEVKRDYLTGVVRSLDRLVHRIHRIDDVVAMWNVARARDAAWTNAEALWAIRGDAGFSQEFVATLDRTVGLAGRGLLIPTETVLLRLARRLRLV